MHPLPLVASHIKAGRLVELTPGARLDVKLYWTVTRLHAGTLRQFTQAVGTTAARELQ
jgi:LysR family transcriptional regulator (chromosome initiation inhibitor)